MKTNTQIILKKISISLLLLLICRCCFAGSASEPTSFGEWAVSTNNPVADMNLKARLVVESTIAASGGRTAEVFVEFQNPSSDTTFVRGYYNDSLPKVDCVMTDLSGRTIPPGMMRPYNGPMPLLCWRALPPGEIVRLALFPGSSETATNDDLIVSAGWNHWMIPHGATNSYQLSGTLNLSPEDDASPIYRNLLQRVYVKIGSNVIQTNAPPQNVFQGTLKLPPVKISAKDLSEK